MRLILAIPILLTLLTSYTTAAKDPGDDLNTCKNGCNSCGFFCNTGCLASVNDTECRTCRGMYCRRESSSCNWLGPIGGGLGQELEQELETREVPPDDVCRTCWDSCWCASGWYCMDGNATEPKPYPPSLTRPVPTTTPTPSVKLF